MEFAPDDFIINAYLTEARLQKNVSAELDALDAAVDASNYPGARREQAKSAFIKAVKLTTSRARRRLSPKSTPANPSPHTNLAGVTHQTEYGCIAMTFSLSVNKAH